MVVPGSRGHRPVGTVLEIGGLYSLAVTIPLLEVLGRGPEFFVAHRLEGTDLAAFLLVVAGAAPALVLLLAWLAARLDGVVGRVLLAATRIVLCAAIVLQAIRPSGLPALALAAIAAIAGAGVEVLRRRFAAVRSFLALLSAALVVAPVVFCVWSPAAGLLAPRPAAFAAPTAASNPPIVFLVFDQLPLPSLLDAQGAIDAAAFPSFAALARTATWFRHTTSVSDRTEYALPAILTGRYPRPGQVPTAASHPENLFTGLGTAYRLHVREPLTRLCPEWLCPDETPLGERVAGALADSGLVYLHRLLPADLAAGLPDVRRDWAGFWRQAVRARWVSERRGDRRPYDWIDGIEASGPRPTLHFLHVLLPHEPFVYLPNGQLYSLRGELPGLLPDELWVDDQGVVAHAYQRHLLQVGTADHFLGLVLDRLRRLGLFDRALIVVTSDHGASFRPGKPYKEPDEDNFPDIMSVPFFLKVPGQRAGDAVDRPTETVDILPTVIDALHANGCRGCEGRSALDEAEGVRHVRMHYGSATKRFEATSDRVAAGTLESARRKIGLFGPGPAWALAAPLAARLLGRPVGAFPIVEEPLVGVWLQTPEIYEDVNPRGPFVPSLVRGDARGRTPIATETLAVAVNGTIGAVSGVGTWQTRNPRRGSWWAVVPPELFRPGRNEVVLYQVEVSGKEGTITLRRTSTPQAGSSGAGPESIEPPARRK